MQEAWVSMKNSAENHVGMVLLHVSKRLIPID